MAYSKKREMSDNIEVNYGMLCTTLGMLMSTVGLLISLRDKKLKEDDLSMLDKNTIRCGMVVFMGMMKDLGIDDEELKQSTAIAMQIALNSMKKKEGGAE